MCRVVVRFDCRIPFVVLGMLFAAACAKTLPQQITDVNRALGQAKDACASVYAADGLSDVEGKVSSMNTLADAGKYKKARKAAEPLLPEVQSLGTEADKARAVAKQEADAAIAEAARVLEEAGGAEAEMYAEAAYGAAVRELDAARNEAGNPCNYAQAQARALEASRLARDAAVSAIAEKKRQEDQRLAEERRRREEVEARRLEEETRRKPPLYTVEQGDSLWKISGREMIYGQPVYWPVLYDANGGLIQDPDMIYPGQELQVPRVASADDMERKLHTLWRNMQ